MIKVELDEQPRTFDLHVGDKHIGRVRACWKGYVVAQFLNDQGQFSDCGHARNVREAAQLVLERAGYGKAAGVDVKRRGAA